MQQTPLHEADFPLKRKSTEIDTGDAQDARSQSFAWRVRVADFTGNGSFAQTRKTCD